MGTADDPENRTGADGGSQDPTRVTADEEPIPEAAVVEDVLTELEALEETVDDPEERRRVRRAIRVTQRVRSGLFGGIVRGYDISDIAEALLGSLLVGVPMAVEGGTNEAGAFMAARPPLVAGTAAFTVLTVVGVLYVSDIQDVRVKDPLWIVPRRLVGVVGVSFVTAVVLLTAWGRVNWTEPGVALATVVVAFLPMSIGAALGDILPGS